MKINEVKNNAFYQLPQWLFDPEYKDMSLRAKVVYALIFDRRSLSLENNWYDKNGDVYMYFTNQQMMEKLNCSEKTIISSKKELEKYGLIKEVRQGVNRPNRLYINGTVKITGQELENLQPGTVKITGQELENLQPINTNNIKTNITNINDDDRPQKLENIQSGTIAQTLRSRGFKLDQIQFQQLFDYIALDGMNIELVQLAISKSADNEARNFRYLKSILDNWKKNGVTTVEEAEQADEKYKSSKKPKTYNSQKDFKSGKYALLGTDISVHEIDPELGF
ncbi:replication initiator protein A [Streptococcus parasanguinis]|uniref:replication initiator protein A n=1 Tax=Streptococcus parasanguinis TaxID=1318 RepID=UPI0039C384CB